MPEKIIQVDQFFRFRSYQVEGVCQVAHCRNALRKGRVDLCQRHYMQWWRASNPLRAAYANLRDSARKRKLPFDISFEDFCLMVSGTPYMEEKGTTQGCYHIDRINACLGYTADNVRVIPMSENIAKGNRERFNYDYRRELLLRKGYYMEPYDDWTDDSELVCTAPANDDPF
jgi:hypothetical protein